MRSRRHVVGSIGIAIGPDRLVAALPGHGACNLERVWTRQLTHPAGEGQGEGELRQALVDLRETTGLTRVRLSVALLPPIVQWRQLELPALRDSEYQRVLAREGKRFFLSGAPQAVAVSRPGGWRRSAAPVLAVAASQPLLQSVEAAAREVGWTLETVVGAHSAWVAAARDLWPALHRDGGFLAIRAPAFWEVLELRRGRLVGVRRLPAGEGARPLSDHLRERWGRTERAPGVPVALAGPVDEIAAATSRLETEDCRVIAPTAPGELAAMPELLAACHAARVGGPELLPEAVLRSRRRSARRTGGALAGTAALLLLGAAGLDVWGLERELAVVRDRRAAIAAPVAQALEVRGTLGDLGTRLSHLAETDATTLQSVRLIAGIAERLPRTAYLTSLRVRGDSVDLEGVATSAAGVVGSLREVPGLRSLRSAGPMRRQLGGEERPIERFRLVGRVESAVPAPVENHQ